MTRPVGLVCSYETLVNKCKVELELHLYTLAYETAMCLVGSYPHAGQPYVMKASVEMNLNMFQEAMKTLIIGLQTHPSNLKMLMYVL